MTYSDCSLRHSRFCRLCCPRLALFKQLSDAFAAARDDGEVFEPLHIVLGKTERVTRQLDGVPVVPNVVPELTIVHADLTGQGISAARFQKVHKNAKDMLCHEKRLKAGISDAAAAVFSRPRLPPIG